MSFSSQILASQGRGVSGPVRSAGFTLIELMVTLAVIAILAVVAVPATQTLVNGNRLAGTSGEVTAALQLARSEAVRRSARVTMCRSTDGLNCAAGTAWTSWIVVDPRFPVTAPADRIIRSEAVAAPIQVSGPAAGIVFRPSGLIASQETVTVCIPTANPADNQRVVTVMVSGTTRADRANGGGACP